MRWSVPILLALCWLTPATRLSAQQPLSVTSAETDSVLLLLNGQTLSGRINRQGDYYLVQVPAGEIRVSAATVELWCRDLAEAYAKKRSALRGRPEEHLDLAQWCIRQQLYEAAAAELESARALEPKLPKLALLERSLALAQEPRKLPPAALPSKGATGEPTNQQLDRLFAELPRETVEKFSHSVQPLLLNHCATAGCHTPGSPHPMSLLKYTIGATPSRRATQRNLYNVLQYVNVGDPRETPLVKAASEPHGGAANPPITARQQAQLEELCAWVTSVTGPAPQAQVRSIPLSGEALLQTPRTAATAPNAPTPASTSPAPPAVDRAASSSADSASVAPQDAAGGYLPLDPFDAEIFNQRFGTKTSD